MHVRALFEDMAITTFDVEPAALARHLPPDLHADVYTRRDGTRCAFVSAVSFRASGVRLRDWPSPRLAYAQVNYRAYVVGPEGRAVWFFRMVMGARWLAFSQRLRGLPLDGGHVDVEAAWNGDALLTYRLQQDGGRDAELVANGSDATPLEAFESDEEAHEVLTHPLVGYGRSPAGDRLRYRVAHPKMTVTRAGASVARFPLFQPLGLVPAGQTPHSVLVARRVSFEFAPPARG